MIFDQAIKIQFNFREAAAEDRFAEKEFGLLPSRDFVEFPFHNGDLMALRKEEGVTRKMRSIQDVLKEFLEHSFSTTIFSNLSAPKLKPQRSYLSKRIFKEPLFIQPPTDWEWFVENFRAKVRSKTVIRTLEESPEVGGMDYILRFLAERDFAPEQELSLELDYLYQDDGTVDFDELFLAIHIDDPPG